MPPPCLHVPVCPPHIEDGSQLLSVLSRPRLEAGHDRPLIHILDDLVHKGRDWNKGLHLRLIKGLQGYIGAGCRSTTATTEPSSTSLPTWGTEEGTTQVVTQGLTRG